MPLTPAERMKRYREKLKQNLEKHAEIKKRHTEYVKSKTKKIAELTKEEKEKQRKIWRNQKAKRKKMVETKINEENSDIDDDTELIIAEEFVADSEGTDESTDPIKTEEYEEIELTRCLENSQNQTNSFLHEGFETDVTEIQNKTEKRKTEDPDLSFFYSLLPDMNLMNLNQKRRFKMGVLQLASDILEEK